jgi:uncharacterized membrane protein YfcA
LSDFPLHVAAGALVGFAIGLTGVGGGSLMTPLLLLFGFPLHVAIGTDLLYAAITKAGGVVAHARRRTIRWSVVGLLAAGSLPASLLTAALLRGLFPDPEAYAPLLTSALGIMLMLTAGAIALRGHIETTPAGDRAAHPNAGPATLAVGVLLGICVTLSSVGAGAFGAAVLMVLYPGLRAAGVVGTDIAHAVPLTLVAGLGHLALGNVDFLLLGALVTGSLPAIWLGTQVGERLPERIMRPLLALLLAGLGLRFAFG